MAKGVFGGDDLSDDLRTTAGKVKKAGEEHEKSLKDVTEKNRKGFAAIGRGLDHQVRAHAADANKLKAANALELKNRETAAAELKMSTDEFVAMMDKKYKEGWSVTNQIMEPLVKLKEGLVSFEVGYGKNLASAGGAIKELTGGLIDLNGIAGDGMDKVMAAATLVATPFKLANTAIAKTTKFLSGGKKEINIGQNISNALFGYEEEIDGKMVKQKGVISNSVDGMRDGIRNFGNSVMEAGGKLKEKGGGSMIKGAATGLVDGAKNMGTSLMEGTKKMGKGALSMAKSIGRAGMALLRGGLSLIAGLASFVWAGLVFVGGLIATGVSMLIAGIAMAWPAILIGLAVAALVGAVIYFWDEIVAFKDAIVNTISSKIQMVKDIFANIFDTVKDFMQMAKDWIREKVLSVKSWFGGLSEEDQAEMDAIQERKKAREEKKNVVNDEVKAEWAAMKERGELEGKSHFEKMQMMANLQKKHKDGFDKEKEYQAQDSQTLKDLRDKADENYVALEDHEKEKKDFIAKQEKNKDTALYFDVNEKGESRQLEGAERSEAIQNQADRKFGTDEDIRKAQEAQLKAGEKAHTTLEGREDYVASKVLSQSEQDEIGAKAMGMSVEEYKQEREDYSDPDYGSPWETDKFAAADMAIDRADGDRIKDAADRAEEARNMPPKPEASANVVAQQNNNNVVNNQSIKDPAPHNPDPTGSRLSVVPAY